MPQKNSNSADENCTLRSLHLFFYRNFPPLILCVILYLLSVEQEELSTESLYRFLYLLKYIKRRHFICLKKRIIKIGPTIFVVCCLFFS